MVKILLLEDDRHYREIVKRLLLGSYPYAVTSVATELQAWEELSNGEFDLVLLDLYIEGRRCWDTLKRTVEHPGKPVAIVFSCEDTEGNADQAVMRGAFAFLSKPFDFVQFRRTIDSALHARLTAASTEQETCREG